MRRNLLLLLLLFLSKVVYSQSVLWEKAYGFIGMDYATSIVKQSNSSNYLVAGTMNRYSQNTSSYGGLYTLKLSGAGDTLHFTNHNLTSGMAVLGQDHADNSVVWLAAQGAYFDSDIHLYKLDTNSLELGHYIIESSNPNVPFMYVVFLKSMSNGDVLLTGQTQGSSVSGMAWDCFVTRMRSDGSVAWTKYYNYGLYTEGYYVEGMANGHYWVSGSVNSSVWGMELDTSGNVVREHIFYSTPTYAKIYNAYVQQLPNQKYLVIGGSVWTDPVRRYVGLYDSNYNLVWQQPEQVGNCFPAYITSDTSIVLGAGMMVNNVYNTTLTKYKQNGSVLWSTNFTGGAYPQTKTISNIAFTGDGDAVFAGYIDRPYPALFDLYFMKVGGIGLPYLPETDSSWLVTSSKPVLSSGAKVSIYPNPASSYVGIVSERNINKVEILDMSGTMVYSSLQDTRKEASVQVSHLRSGIYTVCVYEVDGSVSRQLISIVR